MSQPTGADAPRPFAVECPGCRAHVTIAAGVAGDAAACPLCASVFLIPLPVLDEPLVFAEPPPPSTRRDPDIWLPPPPAADGPAELAFREPVKTIRSGGTEIELRRLTPAERRARRTRRNLVMLVIGAAVLVALVVTLGKTGR